MASRRVSVTEPHPTVPKSGNAYLYGGRGGAGNYKRYRAEDLTPGADATGPASKTSIARSFKKTVLVPVGRGGSGNMYKPGDGDERVFQFDEEMGKKNDINASPVYHIGRGGAANWVDERVEQSRQRQDSSASTGSGDSQHSNGSNVRGALNKFTRRFS